MKQRIYFLRNFMQKYRKSALRALYSTLCISVLISVEYAIYKIKKIKYEMLPYITEIQQKEIFDRKIMVVIVCAILMFVLLFALFYFIYFIHFVRVIDKDNVFVSWKKHNEESRNKKL